MHIGHCNEIFYRNLNHLFDKAFHYKALVAILCFFVISCTPVSAQPSDWLIEAKNVDPNHYYGVTVANGMIGLVSSPEPMKTHEVLLNGIFDAYGRGRVSNILVTFNPANLYLRVDGKKIGQAEISNHQQVLDLKKAVLMSTFDIGDQLRVQHTRRALRHLPYSTLSTICIYAKTDAQITAMSAIEAPNHIVDIQNLYSEVDRPHIKIPLLTSVGKSPTGKHTVAACSSLLFPEMHGQEPSLVHELLDYHKHLVKFNKTLHAGDSYTFHVISSILSSEHVSDPLNEAERLTIYAMGEKIDTLRKRHEDAWNELWKSDIVIEEDSQAQKDVRLALYHLYSFAREGTAYSLSPMGLSGTGFNGHIFWDAELWMFPPLLVLQPAIAKSLLDYRFERLEAAKQNAFSHGYRGAMFPWESAQEGTEETPVWALTGPFQHHITGCVGWAFWKYYQVTKDKEWLRDKGYPVLKEIADFWASRVERKGPHQYEINNVVGANEWQENVDNDAFTNGIAKTILYEATQAAQELGVVPDPDWMHVAQNIPILQFPDGTTKENSSYAGDDIKQADANLLAYPLNIITESKQLIQDLKYYEPRISAKGPAMGCSLLSILYSRLGLPDQAHELFIRSYKPNELPPFGVLAETAGGNNPYFATGAGGMLQAVIFGFGGLCIANNGISQLQTQLPKSWKSLEITGGFPQKSYRVNHLQN